MFTSVTETNHRSDNVVDAAIRRAEKYAAKYKLNYSIQLMFYPNQPSSPDPVVNLNLADFKGIVGAFGPGWVMFDRTADGGQDKEQFVATDPFFQAIVTYGPDENENEEDDGDENNNEDDLDEDNK